jgi:hypothetical protein
MPNFCYRVLPQFRKHYAPYDGELYKELEPPNDIGYAFIDLMGRRRSIAVNNFERIEEKSSD